MRIVINGQHPQPRKIRRVADELERGGIIGYPTDSVYGLGCDILNKKGIDKLYQIKGIPRTQLLSFVCPDLTQIARYAVVDDVAYRVIKRLVPGPYTFILPATKAIPKVLRMNRKTVGIRVPDSPVALALAAELGRPIVSTSASKDGWFFNDPVEIEREFHQLTMVVDSEFGGYTPSTVIDLSGDEPEVVREGAGPVDFL